MKDRDTVIVDETEPGPETLPEAIRSPTGTGRGEVKSLNNPPVERTQSEDPLLVLGRVEQTFASYVGDSETPAMAAAASMLANAVATAHDPAKAEDHRAAVDGAIATLAAQPRGEDALKQVRTIIENYAIDAESPLTKAMETLVLSAIEHTGDPSSHDRNLQKTEDALTVLAADPASWEEMVDRTQEAFASFLPETATSFSLAAASLFAQAKLTGQNPQMADVYREGALEAIAIMADDSVTTVEFPDLDPFAEAVKKDLLGRAEEILAGLEGEARAIVLQATADVATYTGLMMLDPRQAEKYQASIAHAMNTLASIEAEQLGLIRAKIAESTQHVIGMLVGKALEMVVVAL